MRRWAMLLLLSAVCAVRPAAGQTVAPSAEFKSLVFSDDFSRLKDGDEPDGWKILNTMLHDQREVKNGEYRILTRGNTHCPAPIALKDFALEFDVHGEKVAPVTILYIDYRVTPDREHGYSGYRILYRWGEQDHFRKKFQNNAALQKFFPYLLKTARFDVLDLRYRENREPILTFHSQEMGSPGSFDPTIGRADQTKMQDFEDLSAPAHIRIEVSGNRCRLWHNGVFQGEIIDPENRFDREGLLGFDMEGSYPNFPGALYLDNVKIYAREPIPEQRMFGVSNVEIPWKYNRIHNTPMLYGAEVVKYGSDYVLRGNVRGGACTPQSHLVINPYVKLDTADGKHSTRLYLFKGVVGVPPGSRGWMPPTPADTSGPQSAQCYLGYEPGTCRLSVGYDRYEITFGEPLAGPCEVVVDPATGKVLNEGLPMKGGAVVTMSSPKVKKVLDRVRKDNKWYAGFKEFLEDNHFFVDREDVKFRGDMVISRVEPGVEYRAEMKVLDVFRDKILQESSYPMERDSEAPAAREACGLRSFTSGWRRIKGLEPGVYHLRVLVRDSNGVDRGSITRAFSILPEPVNPKQTTAEMSGLPTLHGGAQYPYQPAYQADTYHYSSEIAEGNGPEILELHRALNRRVSITGADLSSPEAIDKLRPYFRYISGCSGTLPKEYQEYESIIGTPRIYSFDLNRFVAGFVKSPFYKPVVGQDIAGQVTEKPNYEKLGDLIKQYYWKEFTAYVADQKKQAVGKIREYMRSISPDFKAGSYAYPYPCNIDYMTPYGGMNSSGINLRDDGWERDICAMENYFDECHYAADRNWACWAMMKMVRPEVIYYRDAEGNFACIADGNNAFGWPPFGAMDVPAGFFKKAVLMNAYNPMYLKQGKVRWAWDNAYRLGDFSREQIDEHIRGFRIVRDVKPDRPVRTVGYLFAQDWVRKQSEVLDPEKYPYNPADESIVFAYEEGNRAGTLNGFFLEPDDLKNITPETVSTLVLPPLKYADEKSKARIRELYNQGINLVSFEDVSGLEDIFGVDRQAPVEVARVRKGPAGKQLLYDVAADEVEHTGNIHSLGYRNSGGEVILECVGKDGKVAGPALVMKQGAKAKALLWTLEPTDIARSRNHVGFRMRGECSSELIRYSMGRALKEASNTPVTTTEGNLISFWGKDGKLYVMVYENAFPFPGKIIHPLLRVRLPGVGSMKLSGDVSFRKGVAKSDELTWNCDLGPDQIAVFTLEK